MKEDQVKKLAKLFAFFFSFRQQELKKIQEYNIYYFLDTITTLSTLKKISIWLNEHLLLPISKLEMMNYINMTFKLNPQVTKALFLPYPVLNRKSINKFSIESEQLENSNSEQRNNFFSNENLDELKSFCFLSNLNRKDTFVSNENKKDKDKKAILSFNKNNNSKSNDDKKSISSNDSILFSNNALKNPVFSHEDGNLPSENNFSFSIQSYIQEFCDYQFRLKGKKVFWLKNGRFLEGLNELLRSWNAKCEGGGKIVIKVEKGNGLEEFDMALDYDEVKYLFFFNEASKSPMRDFFFIFQIKLT